MFKKLHRQMTFFCTLITGIIMITMTAISLSYSTGNIQQNNYISFINEVDTIVTSLSMQSAISYEWIARTENNGQYILHISNNGNPLLYDQLRASDERDSLITRAKFYAETMTDFSLESPSSAVLPDQTDFMIEDAYGDSYYVAAAVIPKSNGYLSVLVIASLAQMEDQIARQRMIFSVISLVAICFLGIFSWFFTRRMIDPLIESQDKQSQFIASASHELRTPLAVMLSSLSALRKADAADADRFAAAIESEGEQMSRLIDDLLLLANADSHDWSLQLEQLEMDTLLIDLFEKYETVAADKHIRVSIHLPEAPLPACRGDKMRTEQLLSIILDNAISYTPEYGRVSLSAAFVPGARQSAGALEIRIADNGPGIPAEVRKQVWERFYRSEKSRTGSYSVPAADGSKKKHFGLGLSIAKEITRLHKGRIWIEDTIGGGATFVMQFPTMQ